MGIDNNNFLNSINQSSLAKKVNKIFEGKESMAILMSDFIKIYGEDEIKKDRDEVVRLKKIFKENETQESKEVKDYADALEKVTNECIELNNWLGEYAFTYSTSVYDDYKNGIDSIIEFTDEEEFDLSHMGLAFDFTYGSNVFKKLERIKNNLDKKELSEIKYFASENTDYKGPIKKIPRLVIGANRETVDDLMETFLESKKPSSSIKKEGELSPSKKLETHYFQINMLKQIIYQLETFRDYTSKLEDEKLYDKLDYFLKKIVDILESKKKSRIIIEDKSSEDAFLMRIKTECDILFK